MRDEPSHNTPPPKGCVTFCISVSVIDTAYTDIWVCRAHSKANGTTIANSGDRVVRICVADFGENVNLVDQIDINLSERFAESQFFVSGDADFLADHFPDAPILPGLIMLEIAVQTAAAWMTKNSGRQIHMVFDMDMLERLYVTRPILPDETLSMRVAVAKLSDDRLSAFFDAEAKTKNIRAMRARFRMAPMKK